MQDLNVTLLQADTVWHNPEQNLAQLELQIDKLKTPTDVIVLPEMFSTGFTMESQAMSDTMSGNVHKWLKKQAKRSNAAICGSVIIEENSNYYNRFLWVTPDGRTNHYDKRHLFRMANENLHFSPGLANATIVYKGWRIRPQICYDLRFPVWSRNKLHSDQFEYDILIYVANWPKARVNAWNSLLKARAIENHAYVLGVNRIGIDGLNIVYNGQSAAYDYKGNEIMLIDESLKIAQFSLNKLALTDYRNQFPAQLDADNFTIEP